MSLADQVAQSKRPFLVRSTQDGAVYELNNVADCAGAVRDCPHRFVLCDDLTRLCTALAYSRGSRSIECADLLRIPATALWIEWSARPWEDELAQHGFPVQRCLSSLGGRRGAFVRASPDGRRGTMRSFWTDGVDSEALASSMEAFFDFDTTPGEQPQAFDKDGGEPLRAIDEARHAEDVLSRCVRFRYERSWREHYDRARLTPHEQKALNHHAMGTIAIIVPVILTFLLLLSTKTGLTRQAVSFERLNRARSKAGKARLLEYVEVRCPLPALDRDGDRSLGSSVRRGPRLHHVRGHLVRRGNDLIWRMPHLRGSARAGTVRGRTVTWTIDPTPSLRAT